jgi:uncharacterized protein
VKTTIQVRPRLLFLALLITVPLFLGGVLGGCASGRVMQRDADRLFAQGRYAEAAEVLERAMDRHGEKGVDRLLYLMDLGLTFHSAKDYKESNRYFLEADRLAQLRDYTSLTTEGLTFFTTDQIRHYSGELFERVMIHTYLALNFALMGMPESALVEARRIDHRLHLLSQDQRKIYQQNAFSRYLTGILYEADREWNDAYISYQKTRELMPSWKGLGVDLWRMATLLRMPDEQARWLKEYGLTEADLAAARENLPRSNHGELVIFYQNGIAPRKRPHPNFYSIPVFVPRYNPVRRAIVKVNGTKKAETAVLHNIEQTAIRNLEDKYAVLISRKVGGVVAKEVLSHQIEQRTGNYGFGDLARLVMYLSDQADLRSWNLLPRDLQIARIPLEPGEHEVTIELPSSSARFTEKVEIEDGKKVYLNFRYTPEIF